MKLGARTPEELETLFEDAFLLQDAEGLISLFCEGAVLVPGIGTGEARGAHGIHEATRLLWKQDRIYVAGTSHVLQARDTALLFAECATSVMRRDPHGVWRYVITVLSNRTDRDGSEASDPKEGS